MSDASSLSCYNLRLLLPIGIPLVPIFALRSHTLDSLALLAPRTVGHQRCYREMACCTTQHWCTAYSLHGSVRSGNDFREFHFFQRDYGSSVTPGN